MGELRVVKKKAKAVVLEKQPLDKPENILLSESFAPSVFQARIKSTLSAHDSEIFFVKLVNIPSSATRHPSLIISASHDKTIRIWNPYTGKLLNTLTGHHGSVWALDVYEDKIVSCATDKTIRIWDINSGKLLLSLLAHQNHVYSVIVSNGMIISAALDKTVKFWDLNSKKLLRVIESADSSVWTLCVYRNHLFGGCGDGTLKVWSLEDFSMVESKQVHDDSITSVKASEGRIITASKDRTLKILEPANLEIIHTLKGHKSSVWSAEARQGRIISGSDDRTVRVWDLYGGKLLDTLQGHTDWVSSVTSDESFIVSASGDNTLKIWEKVPLHNCNTIDFSYPVPEKNPFETEKEFEQKKLNAVKKFYEKIISYDYINIGTVELLAHSYNLENETLPVKVKVQCPKVSAFSALPANFLTSIKISRYSAEQFYKTGDLQNLYIKYYQDGETLKYLTCTSFEGIRYRLDKEIVLSETEIKQKAELKTGRIEITRLSSDVSETLLRENPKHDCNTITTADTFRSPFESQEDFYNRVKNKLTGYGYINIGKVTLIAAEFNIEAQEFPLQANITCDKVLNITELKKESKAKIKINRYSARDMFESSAVHNLFIRYLEHGNSLCYELSVHFQGVVYFLE